ncbi:tryptophanase [Thioalkalicoccus limnaeus]|uniref:Tryptophanase n=1 Tax=Thioalkalicoccus limnaeus TaxID=120681 RepID=A0ABV4B9R8_9GAMM
MADIKFYSGESFPLEMHKVCIVQKLNLLPIEQRRIAIDEAGNNTFLLKNRDVYLDMLTDSGVNAMSDRQQAAMLVADDSYAGSETFFRLERVIQDIFGTRFFLPAHQGRACENIIAQVFVKPGTVVATNYHFTTTKAHVTLNGGSIEEIYKADALEITSDKPFKGDIDLEKLRALIQRQGAEQIAFVRIEAGTNLIGGQPVSLANMRDVHQLCQKHGIPLVLDASLLADNLYFNKLREPECRDMSLREITRTMAGLCDLIYFSARKLGCARGGGMCMNSEEIYKRIRDKIVLYEGFLTYGGMSVREIEAIAVGLEETMDMDMISQGPQFIRFMVEQLVEKGIPVITPPGGLGCHLDAGAFLPHLSQAQYPAGALAAALYLVSGVRGMERGTLSEQRNADGSERYSDMELLRLALPRRVFTMSQVKYAIDRIVWLYEHRALVGGLRFVEEPELLRFFFGRLAPTSDWQDRLVAQFRTDLGDSL